MKTFYIIIVISIFCVSQGFSQQDLLPAFLREISYQGKRVYFNGSPFTGLLVDEKTNAKWGEFRNGYKNGIFTEYYSSGKKKSEGNFVNGINEGEYFEWYEGGQKAIKQNYRNGVPFGKILEWNKDGSIKTDLDLKKSDFNSNYYLGFFYYNKGVEQILIANTVPPTENEKYETELKKADVWFKKAIPYIEECYAVNAEDKKNLETLKNLYYRMKNMEKYNEIGEKLDGLYNKR